MANEVKRMRYFDGLFLKQDEFNLEQDYHIRMRRLHNGALYGWGVIKGLAVQATGAKEVTVEQGLALSRITMNGEELGREIILTEDTSIDLSGYSANAVVWVSISCPEDVKADIVEEKGGDEEIHWWEKTVLSHDSTEPSNKRENIILAKIKIKADGTIDSDSLSAESLAAVRTVAPLTVAGGLNVGGTTNPGQGNLQVEGRCTIKGDLVVEGQTTTISTQNLEVEDNIIVLNKSTGTLPNTSGLEVNRGGPAEAQLLWDESTDKWKAGIKGSLVDLAYGNNAGQLTNNSVADTLHRHSKLVSANGLVDPVISVDNSGKVGIGIASPTQTLDVNGTVRASALMGSGTGLTALNGSQITSGTVGQAYIDPLIARKSEVPNITALTTEITNARGIKANLGNRLDESLTAGGELRLHSVGPDQLTPDLANKINSALQPATYDFARRVTANVQFTQLNGNGAQQTLTLGFRTKFVWATGMGKAILAGSWFGVHGQGYADLRGGIAQMGTAVFIQRIPTIPYWIQDSGNAGVLMQASFVDLTGAPRRESTLNIYIAQVTDTTLVLRLSRIDPTTTGSGQGLANFIIAVQLFCFG